MPVSEWRLKNIALKSAVSGRDRDVIAEKIASSGLPIAEYVRHSTLWR